MALGDEGTCVFGVCLTSYPESVSQMKAMMTICTNMKEEGRTAHNVRLRTCGASLIFSGYSFPMDKVKDELIFSVKMKVTEIYDLNNEQVPRKKWTQLGIIDNQSLLI